MKIPPYVQAFNMAISLSNILLSKIHTKCAAVISLYYYTLSPYETPSPEICPRQRYTGFLATNAFTLLISYPGTEQNIRSLQNRFYTFLSAIVQKVHLFVRKNSPYYLVHVNVLELVQRYFLKCICFKEDVYIRLLVSPILIQNVQKSIWVAIPRSAEVPFRPTYNSQSSIS